MAQTEQKESTVESTTEPESTEDTIDSPKPKKKKKDKRERESAADESLNDSVLEQTSENHQTTAEIDSNANGHHKQKKKKRDKRPESDEIMPSERSTSDSSGYVSEKTMRKRAAESDGGLQDAPAAKKKKKSK